MSSPRLVANHPRSVVTVAIAVPALSLSLLAGTASADAAPTFFVGQNSGSGAVVTASDGPSHAVASRLRAVAGDGTAYVLSAKVTPTRTAAVLVDGTTHVGRIVTTDPQAGDVALYAGNGSVVVRKDGHLSLLNVTTGASTPLADLPAADQGTRTVTAAAATDDGAVVATADVSAIGTSGTIYAAHVWKLTAAGAEDLYTATDQYIPAVAASAEGVDAVLASMADDALTHLHLGTGGSATTPMHFSVAPDVTSAELGYAHSGSGLVPLLTLTRSAGTMVYDMAGELVRTYAAGSQIFVSAGDVDDPTSVSNPLAKEVSLTGVTDGKVLHYGTKVAPTVSATTSGELPPSAAPAILTIATGKRTATGVSGRRIPVTRNVCFTASSPATLFTQDATPETACVKVAHRLELDKFNRRSGRAQVETSAHELRVQVLNRRQQWVTVREVETRHGKARFRVPHGRVRVIALETASNTEARLLITAR